MRSAAVTCLRQLVQAKTAQIAQGGNTIGSYSAQQLSADLFLMVCFGACTPKT